MKRLHSAIFNQHYEKPVINVSLWDESLSDRCCARPSAGGRRKGSSWALFVGCVVCSPPLKEL